MAERGTDGSVAARVGRGSILTWGVWIGARALTLGTLLLLTRALPAEGLGAILSALAIGTLGAALAMGGLPDATTRHAAAATDAPFGRGDVERSLTRFAATLPVIAGLLVLVAVSSPDDVGVGVIAASLLLAATQGATTIVASVYRARGQSGRFALITAFVTSAGRAAVAAAALTAGLGSDAVLWSFVALNAGVIAATWRAAMRGLPDTRSDVEGDASIQLGGIVWSLLGNLHVVVVGALLGAGAAGQFGAALRVAEFSFQFLIAFAVPFLPEATRLVIRADLDALRALYRVTSRWSLLVTAVAAGIGFIAAPALAEIVFPDDPGTTATLLRILFVGYAVHGALGQTYSMLLALGAYRTIRVSSYVALPAVVAGTVVLTQAVGVEGAAVATSLAYAATGVGWAVLVARLLGTWPFDEHYARALVAVAGSLAVAGLAALLAADLAAVPAALAVGLAGVAALLGLLAPTGGLSPSERSAVTRLRSRSRGAPT